MQSQQKKNLTQIDKLTYKRWPEPYAELASNLEMRLFISG